MRTGHCCHHPAQLPPFPGHHPLGAVPHPSVSQGPPPPPHAVTKGNASQTPVATQMPLATQMPALKRRRAKGGGGAHAGHASHVLALPKQGTPTAWTPQALQAATFNSTQARFSDIRSAFGAGYDFGPKALRDLHNPKRNLFHLHGPGMKGDKRVLDPDAPESLLYRREPNGGWTLVGVMYKAGARDGSPTVGTLGFFHRHVGNRLEATEPGTGGMMHVWFTPKLRNAFSPHAPQEIKAGIAPAIAPAPVQPSMTAGSWPMSAVAGTDARLGAAGFFPQVASPWASDPWASLRMQAARAADWLGGGFGWNW